MNVAELYEDMLATTNAANTPTMETAFLSALKKVVADLNHRLRETIASPDYISNEDVGFESYCDNVFHPGVKFYMQRSGQWAQDPDNESYQFYQMRLREVIGFAITDAEEFLTRNEEEE